jgi:beta-phosphoglucomutase-like phosphatase (HAD superfamily)
LIKEFGVVPENEILKPIEYKEIYNNELMKMVNQRIKKFNDSELDVSDYTLKGALNFLELLKRKGVKMYLASGTDTQDVIREAKKLGYAHYFGEHIYGSMGDVTKNAKRMVIENIITRNKLHGPQVAAFGDGPVELREVKKCGGIAVGIASNEVQRFGISFTKRSRLIKAGADIMIPDFSQYSKLFDLLFNTKKIAVDSLKGGISIY